MNYIFEEIEITVHAKYILHDIKIINLIDDFFCLISLYYNRKVGHSSI